MTRSLVFVLLVVTLAPLRASSATQEGSDLDPAGLGDRGSAAAHQSSLDLTNPFTVMCVACHPDDEDGSTLTVERRRYGTRTVTLFATSGEGGQNAVGPELYEELARIRERETREAATIQGSEPYFLRLPDFGFSKSGDEAMGIWEREMGGHEALLELFVAAIRTLKPDVIITNHDTQTGHGQHQATGRLVVEAFSAAADPARFPRAGAVWAPQALYVRAPQSAEAAVTLDTGAFDPVRGLTYREQAFRALLRHATQGPWRLEYMPTSARYALVAGGSSQAGAGIGSPFTQKLPTPPGRFFLTSKDLDDRPALLTRLATELEKTGPETPTRGRIQAALNALSGVALDFRLAGEETTPGGKVAAVLVLGNGGSVPMTIESFRLFAPKFAYEVADPRAIAPGLLAPGEARTIRITLTAPADPLVLDPAVATGPVARVASSGAPLGHTPGGGAAAIVAAAVVRVGDRRLSINDTAYVRVSPPLRVSVSPILSREGAMSPPVTVRVQNVGSAAVSFTVSGSAPLSDPGPNAPSEVSDTLGPGDEKTYTLRAWSEVTVLRGATGAAGPRPVLAVAGVRLLRADVRVAPGLRVGYVRSYENTLPESLALLGVEHTELTPETIRVADLSRFDTIVVDNRAYLKYPDLARYNGRLLEFAREGGNLVVFYHKTGEFDPALAPYPITLGGKRITDESAPVRILVPSHPLFTTPNAIDGRDFDNWVQERGLYFPATWDPRYEALLESHDPGEEPLKGGLLVARLGKGTYVYTSFVWYRQLRGFVPGGFRIFANMISLPKSETASR